MIKYKEPSWFDIPELSEYQISDYLNVRRKPGVKYGSDTRMLKHRVKGKKARVYIHQTGMKPQYVYLIDIYRSVFEDKPLFTKKKQTKPVPVVVPMAKPPWYKRVFRRCYE